MDRLTLAKHVGQEIGSYLKKEFEAKSYEVRTKEDASIVTTIDIEAERRIVAALHENFPNDGVIAEESSEQPGKSGVTWYIDPIDGTANFAAGMPLYGVSLGYATDEGVQGAVIVLPELNAAVIAERGKGAYWNDRRIHVKPFFSMEKSTVLLSYRRDPRVNVFLAKHPKVRILGSAVVSSCLVAAGAAEAYLAFSLKPWDYAAAMLLISEAGGVAASLDGSPASLPGADDMIMSSAEGVSYLAEFVSHL